MRSSLITIAQNSNFERAHSTKTNQNKVVREIEQNLPHIVAKQVNSHQLEFQVTGSAGKGQWANVPWLALFDVSITTSATRGYYIVYLFSKDMSTLYLSLNQGWTYYGETFGIREGKKQIQKVAQYWQKELAPITDNFPLTSIHLNCSKTHILTQGYELGHICGKSYQLSSLPNDEQLFDDLTKLLHIYRVLKGKLVDNNFSSIQKNIIKNCNFSEIETAAAGATLELDSVPQKIHYKKRSSYEATKIDHISQAVNKSRIGLLGENLVLAYEKEKLKNAGCNYIPKHVSQDRGDGAGYDILSYDTEGKEIYIEVKTTKQGRETPFFISQSELNFSIEHADNYYLYRVYHAGGATPKFYIIQGDLTQHFEFEPSILYSSKMIRATE